MTNEIPKPALQGGSANLSILNKENNILKLTIEHPYKGSASTARNPFLTDKDQKLILSFSTTKGLFNTWV